MPLGKPGPDPGKNIRHGIGRPDIDRRLGTVRRLQQRRIQPQFSLADIGPSPVRAF
jgi:hypothetical protein